MTLRRQIPNMNFLKRKGKSFRQSQRVLKKEVQEQVKVSFNEIEKLGYLWRESRTLLSAVEIGLFTDLANCPGSTFDEIKDRLCLHEDLRSDFVDALVSLNMLNRKGNGPDALYSNTSETSVFLVDSSDTYIGDVLELCGRTLYKKWANYVDYLQNDSKKLDNIRDHIAKCYDKASKNNEMSQVEQALVVNKLSVDKIINVAFGFVPSRQLLAAVELDLFTMIENEPGNFMTAARIADRLGLLEERAIDFLYALVENKMLDITNRRNIIFFSNTPAGSHYLVRNKESYAGGFLVLCAKRGYRFWSDLPDALCTGMKQNETVTKNIYTELYQDSDKLEMFMNGMIGTSYQSRTEFINTFDLSKYKSIADIGGGTGHLAIDVAKKYTKIKCIITDLPQVSHIANRYINKAGMEKHVKFIPSDFFNNNIPSADVIIFSNILHNWPLEIKQMLLKKAYDALPSSNGVLVVIDSFIDDDRRTNTYGLLMSLHMLIESGVDGGYDYTMSELRTWCTQTGFTKIDFHKLNSPQSMAVVYKK